MQAARELDLGSRQSPSADKKSDDKSDFFSLILGRNITGGFAEILVAPKSAARPLPPPQSIPVTAQLCLPYSAYSSPLFLNKFLISIYQTGIIPNRHGQRLRSNIYRGRRYFLHLRFRRKV